MPTAAQEPRLAERARRAVIGCAAAKAPAQLAVCRRGVGLAELAGYGVVELRGRRAGVQAVLRTITGRRLAAGDAVHAAGTWWCLLTPYRALALCSEAGRGDVRALLRSATREIPGASTLDLSSDYAAIALAGPQAAALCDAVRLGTPAPGRVGVASGSRPAVVLREATDRFLILVARGHAGEAWEVLLTAGAGLGAARIGGSTLDLLAAGERVTGCLPMRSELAGR